MTTLVFAYLFTSQIISRKGLKSARTFPTALNTLQAWYCIALDSRAKCPSTDEGFPRAVTSVDKPKTTSITLLILIASFHHRQAPFENILDTVSPNFGSNHKQQQHQHQPPLQKLATSASVARSPDYAILIIDKINNNGSSSRGVSDRILSTWLRATLRFKRLTPRLHEMRCHVFVCLYLYELKKTPSWTVSLEGDNVVIHFASQPAAPAMIMSFIKSSSSDSSLNVSKGD